MLDRILAAWLDEAELTDGASRRCALGRSVPHQWFFDGTEHVDPAKEANAQATRLASNTTTLAIEYARQGKDWETELRQRAKETGPDEGTGADQRRQPTTAQPNPRTTEEEIDTDVEQDQAA